MEEYRAEDLEGELGLGREGLIHLALLLGSDYTEGVAGGCFRSFCCYLGWGGGACLANVSFAASRGCSIAALSVIPSPSPPHSPKLCGT